MDFVTSVKTCMAQKYAVFANRASRSEFWYFQLFLVLISVVAFIIDEYILYNEIGPVSWISTVITIVPSVAVSARRLHDIGRSGWWQLLLLIPVIGWIVLVIWWATKSDVGDNKFGPSPSKDASNPESVAAVS